LRICTAWRCRRARRFRAGIGCGDGSNLVPLAEAHPQGRFVSVDQSARLCASAREMAGALGRGTR
jgi:tRNA G46 methylase TrmB